MSEVAEQNQIENNPKDVLEDQMLEQADNFEIKQLGKNYFEYFNYDGIDFSKRYKNKGRELDGAYVEDFNFSQIISNRLRYHLKNDYGFNSELGFRSFKIVSGAISRIYEIDKKGSEHLCFGLRRDTRENPDTDTVIIEYSQEVKDEPKCLFNNKEYPCEEAFTVIKRAKHKNPHKIFLRKYIVEGKQMVTYDWLTEEEKKTKNYSKIK